MEAGNTDKHAQATLLLCSGSVSCSVCLEAVADRGERSIAKLKCGHHFHLDCIGSAFNAKGAMQCPNCRHVENGQWLYANGCRPYEEFTVEELANDEYLYDVHHTEMPFGLPWCPYQGSFSQLSVSLEEAEPPLNTYPDLIVNVLYGEHSSASNGAHLCPYLAVHGISRARQLPVQMNNVSSSNNTSDISVHHRSGASVIGDTFGSHAFPSAETHHRSWHTSSAFPSNSVIVNADEPAVPAVPSHDRVGLPRTDSDRIHRTGSPMPSNYAAHGFYPRTVHGRHPPAMTTDFGLSQSHIHGHGGGQLYHPQSSASSLHGGLVGHGRRSRPRDILVSSRRVVQNIPAEQIRVQGPSAYPVGRNQEGDNMGWHQNNHIYGWQREGFPPLPWVPLDHDSQRWAWFHPSQNPQNVGTEPVNRNYRHSYFTADGATQGRPGISLENPYQRHIYARFSPPFP